MKGKKRNLEIIMPQGIFKQGAEINPGMTDSKISQRSFEYNCRWRQRRNILTLKYSVFERLIFHRLIQGMKRSVGSLFQTQKELNTRGSVRIAIKKKKRKKFLKRKKKCEHHPSLSCTTKIHLGFGCGKHR